jgi:hypothetical protein
VFDRLATTLTGICDHVEHIRMVEYATVDHVPSPLLVREAFGHGKPLGEVTSESPFWAYFATYYAEVIANVAKILSVDLDEVTSGLDVAPATRDLTVASGEIAKGTVAGTHHWVAGSRNGREFARIELFWYSEPGLPGFPEPEYNAAWNVELEGYPSARLRFDLLPSLDPDSARYDPIYPATAAAALRTIPEVCDAPPGILHPSIFAPWMPRDTAPEDVLVTS